MVSVRRRLRDAWRVVTGRAYEAAIGTAQHLTRPINAMQSGDSSLEMAGSSLAQWGRHLDENHDLAIGIIDDLVTNIVGTGIQIEPTPMLAGRQNEELADLILDYWEDWARNPDVTGELALGELQRISCRAWLRDGEFFAQHVDASSTYPFGAPDEDPVRYRVEFLESEMVARDLWIDDENYRQGVWLNAWRAPIAYAVYRANPYDYVVGSPFRGTLEDIKRVPADRILHCKFTRRWPQTRGIPITHGIIRRLDDIKQYEESERVAARIAASLGAYIKKSPDNVTPSLDGNVSGERQMRFQPGMIFDDLLPGEEIGMIDSSRPNAELGTFRASMLRAAAAGTGTRYSSIAKDYNGTYSAQRQELVEAWPHYRRLREHYVSSFLRPVYERWLRQLWLSGRLGISESVPWSDLRRAEYIGPGMGWIDPLKEVQADVLAVQAGFMTRNQVIRLRGGDPRKVNQSVDGEPNLSLVGGEGGDDGEDEDPEAANA